jgi:hypothetical protein
MNVFSKAIISSLGDYEGAVEKRWAVPVEAEFGNMMKAGKKTLDIQA